MNLAIKIASAHRMSPERLAFMAQNNGLYILSDERSPGSTFPVVTMGADPKTGEAGQMHSMKPHERLSIDLQLWPETTTFVGGPYSLQTCEILEEERNALDDSVDFWRTMALNCKPILLFARDALLTQGRQMQADAAQRLLNGIDEAVTAEEDAAKKAMEAAAQ